MHPAPNPKQNPKTTLSRLSSKIELSLASSLPLTITPGTASSVQFIKSSGQLEPCARRRNEKRESSHQFNHFCDARARLNNAAKATIIAYYLSLWRARARDMTLAYIPGARGVRDSANDKSVGAPRRL